MNIIIIGPPGGGKGTYSERISQDYEIPHISTGDIFREEVEEGSEIGKKVRKYLDKGELVSDEIVNQVIQKRLSKPDSEKGFVLDGYPRTKEQAEALDEITDIDLVINLVVPEYVIIERLSNRRICRGCGKIYNQKYDPPENEKICDDCGGEIYQREDDRTQVIKNRINEYKIKAKPLIDYYRKKGIVKDIFVEQQSIEEMVELIKSIISKHDFE